MIRRLLVIPRTKSFFLFGPRGTGKSTWLQQEFDKERHLWIDLTDPDMERRYARRPAILIDEWKSLKGRSRAGTDLSYASLDLARTRGNSQSK
ncbi:MAG: hypothetical protein HYY16_05495 [Planctomycetes bacterium]|nr:hypothetical protein [Planctomycetota bacterium]